MQKKSVRLGRPKSTQADTRTKMVGFCVSDQSQKHPIIIENAVELANHSDAQLDGF
jgi:hypothetical protein